MPTIKDVAKQAGVSVATVSRVLNKKGYVSKEAEKAVSAAIKKLDYRPNAVARSLYHKTSGMIGLVLPDISNPFFPELARAVEDVALAYGYTVVFCNTDEEVEKEQKYFEALKQKYVDGIILSTSSQEQEAYHQLDLPLVALDRILGENIPTVVSENRKGAELAATHLLDNGCRHLAHLRGPEGVGPADERYEGFMEVVRREKIPYIIKNAGFDMEKAKQTTLKLIRSNPSIDGIFAGSDITAAGAMHALAILGKKVPDDVKVIGFDGIPLGSMLVPGLTTIEQPIYKMGALAARLLIKQIEKNPHDKIYHELPVKLIVRGTTEEVKNDWKSDGSREH
ncbi:LacI family DNA-binding transcriptional regulator [Alkalicoccus halolimnae]|uniref:Catabolite control protein A n=1 Tax=Alkalicoccus halolimnae TaxID=1667239 RepID=A0A5C7FLD2_9BACI|nr:LacI family DNA-binding transcriptional regulator [Alkalicoccus halolimnae]TXF85535.1 LacI family transcriptional regulator [Alkalicoccus halolimnae]